MAEPTRSPHDPVIKPMALTLQGLRPVNRMNKKGGVAWSHTPTVRPDEIAAANRPAIPRPCCGEKENGIAAAIWLNHLILDSTRLNRSTKDSRLFKTSDFAREVLECWRSPQPLASYTFRRRTQNAERRTQNGPAPQARRSSHHLVAIRSAVTSGPLVFDRRDLE